MDTRAAARTLIAISTAPDVTDQSEHTLIEEVALAFADTFEQADRTSSPQKARRPARTPTSFTSRSPGLRSRRPDSPPPDRREELVEFGCGRRGWHG
jgi:hypothetical protein